MIFSFRSSRLAAEADINRGIILICRVCQCVRFEFFPTISPLVRRWGLAGSWPASRACGGHARRISRSERAESLLRYNAAVIVESANDLSSLHHLLGGWAHISASQLSSNSLIPGREKSLSTRASLIPLTGWTEGEPNNGSFKRRHE
jgi:hypothetical protein